MTTNLPAAQAAYEASLAAMQAAHDIQSDIVANPPVDWAAYDAAAAATAAARGVASQAEAVYEAAILDNDQVAALVETLAAQTASLKAQTAALTRLASSLNTLTTIATDVANTLAAIAKYVPL